MLKEPERTLRFIGALRHTIGEYAGHPFMLDGWQEKIVRDVFGTLDENGNRIVRTVYIEAPKKCGKSTLAAAIAAKLLLADSEPGAQIFGGAFNKDQASVVFDQAAQMILNSPAIRKHVKVLDTQKRIVKLDTKTGIPDGSYYSALSAQPGGKHGINPHGVIFDEIHTQRNRKLWDVLTGSSVTRRQPLNFVITNSGSERDSICWELHEYAHRIISGEIVDPTFYAVLYNMPDAADWKDESEWYKVNPALGKHVKIEEYRRLFKIACESPSAEMEFRRWYLGQWTQQISAWIATDKINNCIYDLDLEAYRGRPCWIGLDLSSKVDLTAMVLVFPNDDGSFDFLPFFWLPGGDIDRLERVYNLPLRAYASLGYLELTNGQIVDYDYIERKIEEVAKVVKIQEICFDPWNATQVCSHLMDKGYGAVEVRQTFQGMSEPTKTMEALILSGKARLARNPILQWNFQNALVQSDRKGNVQVVKDNNLNRRKKVDGVVAAIIGLSRAYEPLVDAPMDVLSLDM